MSYEYSEDVLIESATQDVLEQLGWTVVTAWHKKSFGETGLLGKLLDKAKLFYDQIGFDKKTVSKT